MSYVCLHGLVWIYPGSVFGVCLSLCWLAGWHLDVYGFMGSCVSCCFLFTLFLSFLALISCTLSRLALHTPVVFLLYLVACHNMLIPVDLKYSKHLISSSTVLLSCSPCPVTTYLPPHLAHTFRAPGTGSRLAVEELNLITLLFPDSRLTKPKNQDQDQTTKYTTHPTPPQKALLILHLNPLLLFVA